MKTPPKTEAPKKTVSKAKALKPKAPAKAKAKAPARAPAKGPARAAVAKAAAKPKPKPKLGPKSKAVAKAAARPGAKAAPAPKSRKAPKAVSAAQQDPSVVLTALAVAALEDLKGVDIKVLDVRDLTTIADAMVMCTGTSNRHVKSLAENVVDLAKQRGFRPLGIEGLGEGEWVLVDLNGVLVHVMQAQTRLFYQLEKLWDMSQLDATPA